MSVFDENDENESELKKRRVEDFEDTNGNENEAAMDFVDQDNDTESLKDLSAQIEACKKTLKSNNEQIAQLRDP
jgi:hypothetical protein